MTPLQWAMAYGRRGWPVFPCNPQTKRPLVKSADKGEGGVKMASTDAAQIEAWWTQFPKAMIGFATGLPAEIFVVDIDAGTDKKTGEDFAPADLLRALEIEIGVKLPATWKVKTPRGGWHLYFRMPAAGDTFEQLGNRTGLIDRVDIRGIGGYVILPPSTRPDGESYAWQVKPKADDAAAIAPLELVDCIMRRGKWADGRSAAGVDSSRPTSEAEKPGFERKRSISERAAATVARPDNDRTGGHDNKPLLADIEGEVRKYALAALDGETEAVAAGGQGERNNRLNIAALKLGAYIGAGALSRRVVEAALEDAATKSGLVKDDGRRPVLATIESGISAGLKNPRDLSAIRAQAAERLARRQRRGASRDYNDLAAEGGGSPPASFLSPPPPADAGEYGRILPTEDDAPENDAGGSKQAGNSAVPPATANGGGGKRGRPRGHDDPAENDDDLNLQLAFFPMTDLGNAERFSARYRDRLKFCPQLGWLWWNGKHWSRLNAFQKVTEAIHDTVRAIQREAQALIDFDKDCVVGTKGSGKKEEEVLFSQLLKSWGRSSEGAGHMSSIAGKEGGNAAAYLAIDETALDIDPFKFNVQNGTLVLRKGHKTGDLIEFRRHDPADLITKIMPVEYRPDAACLHYDTFLAEVQPHAAMRRFLHQWGGLSLTGDVSEQKFAFFYGKGLNGKSTLLEGWAHVAGDYGRAVPVETFVTDRPRSGSGPSPDLAMLRSVRFAHTNEPEKGVRLSEGLVKLVTGGDQVPARELNMPFFMLRPAFKLTMSGNYKPRIEGGEATHGIWRRVCFVPWLVTIAEEKIDRKLPDKLRAEASGILNRLLDGLRDWAERGLVLPDEVVEATEAYRAESDPLGRFLTACIKHEPGHREQSSLVYDVFNAWATAAGERGSGGKVWSPRGFAQAMSERGYAIKHSNVNWWTDIRLVRNVGDFVDHDGKPIKESGDGAAAARDDDTVPL